MTGRLKFFICCGVAVAFTAALPFLHAKLTPETIYRRISPSVIALAVENKDGERFVGSGFIALADDTAITAWHVVADAGSVWATFADGQRVKVIGCIDKSIENDVALIKLEKRVPGRQALLSPHLQSVGARAYVIGSPRGLDFSISDGLISQIRSIDGYQQYQLSCPVSPGSSGGPVLNERGEVIGITSWRKADAQNVSFAVPLRTVTRLNGSLPPTPWEHLGLSKAALAGPSGSMATVDAALKGGASSGNWDDFKQRLDTLAGRTVTIVVRSGSQEEKFSVAVPKRTP